MNTVFLERIEKALNEKGFSRELAFKCHPKMREWGTQSAFSMYRDGDAEITTEGSRFNISHIDGYSLYVNTVCRHNGTSENVNVDITVSKFDNGLGRILEVPEGVKKKVRINQNCSDKVFNKRIQTIVEAYEEILEYNR